MQMGWPQEQLMSGIFSIASHWVLQYLPEVAVQEQTGCAHFAAVLLVSVGGVMCFSLLAIGWVIRGTSIGVAGNWFCPIRDSFVWRDEWLVGRNTESKIKQDHGIVRTWGPAVLDPYEGSAKRIEEKYAHALGETQEHSQESPRELRETTKGFVGFIRGSWLRRRIRRSRRRRR